MTSLLQYSVESRDIPERACGSANVGYNVIAEPSRDTPKDSHVLSALGGFLQTFSSDEVLVDLGVLHAGIRRLAAGHHFPHGDTKGPLTHTHTHTFLQSVRQIVGPRPS